MALCEVYWDSWGLGRAEWAVSRVGSGEELSQCLQTGALRLETGQNSPQLVISLSILDQPHTTPHHTTPHHITSSHSASWAWPGLTCSPWRSQSVYISTLPSSYSVSFIDQSSMFGIVWETQTPPLQLAGQPSPQCPISLKWCNFPAQFNFLGCSFQCCVEREDMRARVKLNRYFSILTPF